MTIENFGKAEAQLSFFFSASIVTTAPNSLSVLPVSQHSLKGMTFSFNQYSFCNHQIPLSISKVTK
jgi:hypothetical protein